MNDLDPRLARLREIEVRIAFAEYHIGEQRELVARLTRLGLENSLAHKLLRSMLDSLSILRSRQGCLLEREERTPGPLAVPPASDPD